MARQMLFGTDDSQLDLTHSVALGAASAVAKTSPRPFDVSLTNIQPPSSRGPQTLFSPPAATPQSHRLSDILSEKIRQDVAASAKLREEETRLREELDRSKLSLIEKYQVNETKLQTELNDAKESFEKLLREKEAVWAERDAMRLQEIEKLEHRVNDILEMSRKRLADKDKSVVEQLEKQENLWKDRMLEAARDYEDKIDAIHNKLAIEKESHLVAEKARMAAKEDQVKQAFDAKLRKYEEQVHEVMRNYHDKELIIHGSLDEARKEIVLMRNAWAAQESRLRDELAAKDRIINRLQGKLHVVDDLTKVADSWRSASRDLARMVVKACVTIQELPPLPAPPKETTQPLLMGYVKEDEAVQRQRQVYLAEAKVYQRMRKENVAIQRALVSRALRNSKKVIERVQAETVPAADFRLTGEEDDDQDMNEDIGDGGS